jgi:hypothetical protein
VEQIEEFIVWKGAFELAYLLENTDDTPYKYEVYDILIFCLGNYKEENGYILKYLNRCSPTEETNALKEPMEEEIAETASSLDDQEEEEWSYPCLPPNKSNSLTNTLFDRPPCLTKEVSVIFILLSLFMMLLKIIVREANMVVGILMLLKHLSLY